MTTTNGGSQGRIVEHVDGIVQSFNDRGIHLSGESAWRNYSKFASALPTPAQGQRVRLGLDASGFVRELQVLDEASAALPNSADRDREIRRLACLKAAASFAAGKAVAGVEVSSSDVLKIAEAFERWVQQAP
jgi:hypothetical protein